jgi:hypothetical protein
MPTLGWIGPYRIFFFASDRDDPAHVHVARDDAAAKVWLLPVRLAANFGFNAREIVRVVRIVTTNRDRFLEAWHEFFAR